MEEKLKAKLKDDETLLWTARPETFEILDKTHKAHFVVKAILVSVVAVAAIAMYVNAALKAGASVQIAVILIALAAAGYGIFGEFLDGRKLQNKTLYALTDQRMIALMGMSFEAVDYGRLKDYEFVTDEDGHTSLLCGERARDVKPYGRRSVTVCGAQNNAETGECHGFAMYGITKEVKNIEKIISGRIGVEQ